jgi:hypothetical protein
LITHVPTPVFSTLVTFVPEPLTSALLMVFRIAQSPANVTV